MDWFLDLRAHGHGGPVGTLKVGDGTKFFDDFSDLFAAVRGRDVILMAHGYNVNRSHGTQSLNQWKARFHPGDNSVFIGILWPGDCILPIFIDYVWEGSEAQKSGKLVGEFVQANFGAAASLTFISHSLGARVVLEAIASLADDARVRELILLAAAVEDDTLLHEFADAAGKAARITAVHSMEDHVLQMAYPAGNLLGGLLERGDPNVKAALGRVGAADPVAANIVVDPMLPVSWDYGHTDYLSTDSPGSEYEQPVKIPETYGDPEPPETPPDIEQHNQWKPCWSPAFATTRWMQPPRN
ncbi:MAG TPA: alpha/beta hydrolase [Acidobacteriaceae bacterium]